ncbi:tRNA (adenosine(37)-N6)-threonylcarbamoyltransferase complex dimerization subunit type 1 TsaB [Lutimaribacter marinistellae]|uniref:tRNA (Adenosine(37)-N6)-threonylcarbamoyltransferase complex dimerization subunit type 1 TsaB n=1 Tax=Lutimaribacter marinistellae TaxID=1820329 RepID=A0ABV7TED5_9RHOB
MPSDPLILGFDTSAAHCAAALLRGETIVACMAEEMAKGQAERLIPLLEEVLATGEARWSDLSAIGVGVGPGNFTGIRIAVSAARGLALGLGVPAVGVDGFAARALSCPPGAIPIIPAPRDQVYVRPPGEQARLMPRIDATTFGVLHERATPSSIAEAIAREAAMRWQHTTQPPAPLYLKPADAAPSRDQAPILIDP